ncbi:Dynein heavy chain 14; axonemal [Camelus dromedarius]|uniref:Dynein heavy chain 14 n=1 Tax=Camelus dromedarius TaxID=9838 RepID=A0A5N4CJN4_CAMDR|nr:Dynein heavy chain 14; axonemal [Camelus dromedarius]
MILNSIKVDKDLRKICAPIFEVNLHLRTPAESNSSENSKENLHESDKCREKSVMCEDEISENEVSLVIKHSNEELLPVMKPESSSFNLEILSDLDLTAELEKKYMSDGFSEFPTDLFITPNRLEFSRKIQNMLTDIEICITKIIPLCQDPRLSVFTNSALIMDLPNKRKGVIDYKNQTRWPDCQILFEMDPAYQSQIVDSSLQKLECAPTEKEEFVEHFTFLDTISSKISKLEKEFSAIAQLYSVVRYYQIHISEEQIAIYKILLTKFDQLKTSMKLSEANKDAAIAKFRNNLEVYITGLRVDVSNLKAKIRDPVLLYAGTQVSTAMEMIHTLSEEAASLAIKAKTYSNYQDRFDDAQSHMHSLNMEEITQIVLSEIADIEYDLTLRKILWDAQEDWGTLFREWRNSTLHSIDIESVHRNVSKWMQIIFVLEKGLPKNDMMFQYENEINEISTSATNEAALEKMLFKIIDLWNTTPLHLVPHHTETYSILIISSIDDILAQLEESQIILATVKGTSYLGPIKDLADEWDQNLTLFSYTLEEWMNCQRNWLYLEPIFHSTEIQR